MKDKRENNRKNNASIYMIHDVRICIYVVLMCISKNGAACVNLSFQSYKTLTANSEVCVSRKSVVVDAWTPKISSLVGNSKTYWCPSLDEMPADI